MKKMTALMLFLAMIALLKPAVFSHCEVPCGIYDDQTRFIMIEEHIVTIEKAIKQITELSSENPLNMNQIVRWVINKEKHAEEIQHIISQYFLTQRLKPVAESEAEAYKSLSEKLVMCHRILVYAMKTKQTTELDSVRMLKTAVKDFKASYLPKHDH